MEEVRRINHIDAPVVKIFNYLQDPRHLLDIWPGTLEIEMLELSPIMGAKFRWVHRLANTRFEGCGECKRSIPEKRVVYEISGGIAGRMDWLLAADNDHTKVALLLGYQVHAPWFRNNWPARLQRERDADAIVMLNALKTHMETGPTVVTTNSESKRLAESGDNTFPVVIAR